MKADFPIVEVDALPPELRARVGTPLYRAMTQQRAMLQGNLTHRDNFNCAIVEWEFKHGREELFANPLPNGVTPLAFEPLEAWDTVTRAPMTVLGTPRFNRTRRDDGRLPITINFDLRHTEPRARFTANASQTLTTAGANKPLSWPNTIVADPAGVISITSNGAGPTNTRVTVSQPGTYAFFGTIEYGANVTGTRWAFTNKNDNGAGNATIGIIFSFSSVMCLTDGNNTSVGHAGEIPLSAGDYFEVNGWQNSGATLTVLSRTFLNVHRLHNDSTPTGTVRGVLWGG